MDWFSWLSKSNLEPTLVYQYGLSLTQNELEHRDIRYFNHEFLQSVGISIAKHRLEILKLVRKDKKSLLLAPNSVSRILNAFKKTRNCLSDYIRALIHGEESSQALMAVVPWDARNGSFRWRRDMLKRSKTIEAKNGENDNSKINGLKQETLGLGRFGSVRVKSPPLQERLLLTNGSFGSSWLHQSEYDDDDDDAYWGQVVEDIKWDSMFQDLKPT